MKLKSSNDDNHKKECWLEFRLNNELLLAYTIYGSFEGELEATLETLAYENDCETSNIKTYKVYK